MTSSFQFLTLSLYILATLHHTTTTTTLSQPTSNASPPPGPTNITKILEKAGQYTVLIRLFHMTQLDNQITTQLNHSDQGITLFAPTDNAFSSLKTGVLNSLSDQQKVELVQFHVVPTFLSTTQFQTISNPLRTQAGDTTHYKFPLNITTNGNQVNISTGVINATVANNVYNDGSLAVYQVDTVLLPMSIFGPPAPAPEHVPAKKSEKSSSGDVSPAADEGSARADVSSGIGLNYNLHGYIVTLVVIVMFCLSHWIG